MEFNKNIFESKLFMRVFMINIANRIVDDALTSNISVDKLKQFINDDFLVELNNAFIDLMKQNMEEEK